MEERGGRGRGRGQRGDRGGDRGRGSRGRQDRGAPRGGDRGRAPRGGRGQSGPPQPAGPTKILTNFYDLASNPANNVGLYFVEFAPDVEAQNRPLRMKLINSVRTKVKELVGDFLVMGLNVIAQKQRADPFSFETEHEGEQYMMNFRLVGTIGQENKDAFRMYANVALKRMIGAIGLRQVTRQPKYFDPNNVADIPQRGLEVWRGYLAGFGHHMDRLLLNIDFSSKIIRTQTVYGMIEDIKKSSRGEQLAQALNKALVDQIVMTRYGNNRCYKISEVLLNENPSHTFDKRGEQTSYMDYFRSQYGQRITDARQPLLKVFLEREKREIRLIPELCCPTGLTDEMRNDFKCMNDVANFTRLRPNDRQATTNQLAESLETNPQARQIGEEFTVRIDPRPLEVTGHKLAMPQINVGRDRLQVDDKANFMIRDNILEPIAIKYWAVISTNQDQRYRESLIKTLFSKANPMGVDLGDPYKIDFNPNNLESIIANLHKPPQNKPPPEIALIILPPKFKHMYGVIKDKCTRVSGVPTQVVMANTLGNQKRYDSAVSKILLQIIAKRSASLWAVTPTEGIPAKTMIVGIDVFHDNVRKQESVVGLVASVHPDFSKFYSTVHFQGKTGEEIAPGIGNAMRNALKAFYKTTRERFMPECIIVYRDGVGDSQIEAVRNLEIEAMKQTFQELEINPSLIYIIVNKQTNAKFYERSQRGIDNPRPGTVIMDEVVPNPESFWLISHAVTQGMASPTRYEVIHKDVRGPEISTKMLAELSFKMCYMYYNWTGGIKVPAPVMMADRIAQMVGQHIHAETLEPIRMLPWYY